MFIKFQISTLTLTAHVTICISLSPNAFEIAAYAFIKHLCGHQSLRAIKNLFVQYDLSVLSVLFFILFYCIATKFNFFFDHFYCILKANQPTKQNHFKCNARAAFQIVHRSSCLPIFGFLQSKANFSFFFLSPAK